MAEQHGTRTFTDVCASLALGRILLDRHPVGHAGVLPVGIDEPRVVASLVEGLARATAGLSFRFRLAFHEGVTTLAAGGFGGNAIAKVRRLAGSPLLRAALAEHPHVGLAVMLSASVFEDVSPRLPPGQSRQIEFADPGRKSNDIAWLFIPGCF